jgi:hypothetical protein
VSNGLYEDPRQASLTKLVDELKTVDVPSLNQRIGVVASSLDKKVGDLAARQDAAEKRLAGLLAGPSPLDGVQVDPARVAALESRLEALSQTVDGLSDLPAAIKALAGRLDGLDGHLKAVGGRQDTTNGDIVRQAESIGTLASQAGRALEEAERVSKRMGEWNQVLDRLHRDVDDLKSRAAVAYAFAAPALPPVPDLAALPTFEDTEPRFVAAATYRDATDYIEKSRREDMPEDCEACAAPADFYTAADYRARVALPKKRLDRWRHRADLLTIVAGFPIHGLDDGTSLYPAFVLEAVGNTIEQNYSGDSLVFMLTAELNRVSVMDITPADAMARVNIWEARCKAHDEAIKAAGTAPSELNVRSRAVLPRDLDDEDPAPAAEERPTPAEGGPPDEYDSKPDWAQS